MVFAYGHLWVCPDLDRSFQLPKLEGYQATPQTLIVEVLWFYKIDLVVISLSLTYFGSNGCSDVISMSEFQVPPGFTDYFQFNTFWIQRAVLMTV